MRYVKDFLKGEYNRDLNVALGFGVVIGIICIGYSEKLFGDTPLDELSPIHLAIFIVLNSVGCLTIILAIIRAMIRGDWRIKEYLALIGALALIYWTIDIAVDANKGWLGVGVVLVVLFIAWRKEIIELFTGPYTGPPLGLD